MKTVINKIIMSHFSPLNLLSAWIIKLAKLIIGNKKKSFVFYLFLFLIVSSKDANWTFIQSACAQQDAQYSQYMFNQFAINPAYAGSKDAINTNIFYRSAWVDVEGAPTTTSFDVQGPMHKKNAALGFNLIHETIGPKKTAGIFGSYAYRIKIRNGKLSFGLRAGIYQNVFDWGKITYKDKLDIYDTYTTESHTAFNTDAGLYYYSNTLYWGISVTHLNKGRIINLKNKNGEYSNLLPHLFFTGGKAWEVTDKLIFSPSYMIKYVEGAPICADFNFSFLIKQQIWVGLSFRTGVGIVTYLQYKITDKFKIGYAYDIGLNKLGASSNEIMISYDIKVFKKPAFISPRYF